MVVEVKKRVFYKVLNEDNALFLDCNFLYFLHL